MAVTDQKNAEYNLPSLTTRIQWFDDWEYKTRTSRRLARLDRDYYDNKQWSNEDLALLKERNQPALVKNHVSRKVNFVIGEEIKKRTDPIARPRTPNHDDGARAITDALRYVEEKQKTDKVRTAVMKNMLVEGFGGAIKEVDDENNYAHKLTHVQWDRLFYDPHSRCSDFSDAKYVGIVIWTDLDDAIDKYPDAEDELRASLAQDVGTSYDTTTEDTPRQWIDRKRDRIKIVEMYVRVGRDYFRFDFTQFGDLTEPDKTAYMDERNQRSICPLKMASCYIDAEGMRYGIVRQLISPQDEINKRASKALHLLSVRQVIAERDAVIDPQKFQEELAKPDGYAETEPDAMANNRVQISPTGDLAQGQVSMMQQAIADINAIGPSASTMPDLPAGSSGRAFMARQQAASQELGEVFDSLRDLTLAIYTIDWLCIKQYWTEEMWLRVTDDDELTGYRFVALNQDMTRAQRLQDLLSKDQPPQLPKALEIAVGEDAAMILAQTGQQHQAMVQQAQQMGQQVQQGPELEQHMIQMLMQHPAMQKSTRVNNVAELDVDIIIDVSADVAIIAQEEFDSIVGMMPTVVQARPDMAPVMARLAIKSSQLRNKRELLQELDKGQDPQQAQMQQQVQQLQLALQQSQIELSKSAAALNAAKAASEQAQVQIDGAKVESEIEKNQAAAMRDAAAAGETAGG